MSKPVVYYSHTYYDVNGSFDAVKCDIWYAHNMPSINVDIVE